MNTRNDLTRDDLLKAISKFKITPDIISKSSGLSEKWIKSYLEGNATSSDISSLENCKLSSLAYFLSQDKLAMIDEDERLKGRIEILIDTYNLNYEVIALYSNLNYKDIENFMNNPKSISYEKKYKLAMIILSFSSIFEYK
ncbi:MAG: hypothetical protein MJH09_11025 [Cetobacterium sp.]|nr:hypothetical protein [Cetobacterium sp.]